MVRNKRGTSRLLKKSFFEGCSKRTLPSPKRFRAGRQMQVEPCEIPLAGAPEVLRCEAYFAVRLNNACAPKRFSAQATKDLPTGRDNAADSHFSATCSSTEGLTPQRISVSIQNIF
jgi:hypothetical protein